MFLLLRYLSLPNSNNNTMKPLQFYREVKLSSFQEKGLETQMSEDTMSTSSSMLDTSHDSSYESRKISSISVHDAMETPRHRNSFITSSTPAHKPKMSSSVITAAISEERLDNEKLEQKPAKKGPAPPPPQYSPPVKKQRSVSDVAPVSNTMNGDHRDLTDHVVPVTPVISDKEVSMESESGDTLVDSEDEDLSPEKDRVLQMLDSVIQEQEESFVGEITSDDEEDKEEEPEQRTASPAPSKPESSSSVDQDDEPICISSSSTSTLSSGESSSSSTEAASSPSSPVQQPSVNAEITLPQSNSKQVLSPRPTSISPGASRPETPQSSPSTASLPAPSVTSPRSLSPSPTPSPSMDRPSPDGSSTGGSPLPPWPKSRSPSPKNNVEVTVIELAPSSLDSAEAPAAPPSSLTRDTPPATSPTREKPATPDRHVSVIVVGNHQDYKVQDSSSIGSPSPQVVEQTDSKSASNLESLSPPPGFESTSSDQESMSSTSEDGRKSSSSKQSGTSLRIEGITSEETSTDLSLDLGRMNNSIAVRESSEKKTSDKEETESVPEEPIVPVLKTEAPKKVKEPKRQDSVHKQHNNNNSVDTSVEGRKVSKERREKPSKGGSEDKLARQEEDRRIAQEVREGRERYDRRSQDRLDDIRTNGEHHQEHIVRSKGERSQSRKESGENHVTEARTTNKKEIDASVRANEKVANHRDQNVPDLVQKNPTPVKNNYNKKQQEVYKKTQRSTSEASGLHPQQSNISGYNNESDSEEVILRKKPAKPEPDSSLNETHEIGSAIERKKPLTKEDIQKMNLKKKTRKRTRKFEIDGVTVTTTTSKVIYRDEDNETFYDEHYFRKQELRELKMLQKQEQKQFQDLAFKNQLYREQQEKRFDGEKVTLMKNYENDLTSMVESQKKQVDKCENQQQDELRVSSKRIRNEQDKELKSFRESLKQEIKYLKHEVEMLPKDRRKEALKVRKDQLEREHVDRERGFVERLNDSHETHMKRLSDTHREKIALLGKL